MIFQFETTAWGVQGGPKDRLAGFTTIRNYYAKHDTVHAIYHSIRTWGFVEVFELTARDEPGATPVGLNGQHIISVKGPVE